MIYAISKPLARTKAVLAKVMRPCGSVEVMSGEKGWRSVTRRASVGCEGARARRIRKLRARRTRGVVAAAHCKRLSRFWGRSASSSCAARDDQASGCSRIRRRRKRRTFTRTASPISGTASSVNSDSFAPSALASGLSR